MTRVTEEPGTITHQSKTVRIIRIKTTEGDFKEHVLSVEREDRKQKTADIIQKIHIQDWNVGMTHRNLGNQSQDVRNKNSNIQSKTQNETGAVIWSNQGESDEASVQYILTMVNLEIESTSTSSNF